MFTDGEVNGAMRIKASKRAEQALLATKRMVLRVSPVDWLSNVLWYLVHALGKGFFHRNY